MLELKGIEKRFENGTLAVSNLSLQVNKGETLVLLGSSGCGKTTLLKMINRLIEPTSGTIRIDGTNILDLNPIDVRRSIGYVIQGIGLFPHMTVEENVSVVLKLSDQGASEVSERIDEVLETVGLPPAEFRGRYPDELSGGQQQRIGVARALAPRPALMLMDEPFGALDAVTRDTLQQELIRLKAALNKTIVFVTHDIFEAFILADRIAIVDNGVLQQVGSRQEIITAPATRFVEKLLDAPRRQLSQFSGILGR